MIVVLLMHSQSHLSFLVFSFSFRGLTLTDTSIFSSPPPADIFLFLSFYISLFNSKLLQRYESLDEIKRGTELRWRPFSRVSLLTCGLIKQYKPLDPYIRNPNIKFPFHNITATKPNPNPLKDCSNYFMKKKKIFWNIFFSQIKNKCWTFQTFHC